MPEADDPGSETRSAEAAFAALANETRIRILQELGEAREPLSFTALRERVGIEQGREFNYHLGKLLDHFVEKRDRHYLLRPAGRRVVEAVLSGTMTQSPVIPRTEIHFSCWYCGAPSIEMDYREEMVTLYCPACGGTYGSSSTTFGSDAPAGDDRLGALNLPPAGVRNRSAREVAQAALHWYMLELESVAAGICPRCSGVVEKWPAVCPAHDQGHGVCDHCDRRYAVALEAHCTNCVFEINDTIVGLYLLATAEVYEFLIVHGFDPIAPTYEPIFGVLAPYEEVVHSADPLEAQVKFTIETQTITLSVDDELEVVNSFRESATTDSPRE